MLVVTDPQMSFVSGDKSGDVVSPSSTSTVTSVVSSKMFEDVIASNADDKQRLGDISDRTLTQ